MHHSYGIDPLPRSAYIRHTLVEKCSKRQTAPSPADRQSRTARSKRTAYRSQLRTPPLEDQRNEFRQQLEDLPHSLPDQSQTTRRTSRLHRPARPRALRTPRRLSRRILRRPAAHRPARDLRRHLRSHGSRRRLLAIAAGTAPAICCGCPAPRLLIASRSKFFAASRCSATAAQPASLRRHPDLRRLMLHSIQLDIATSSSTKMPAHCAAVCAVIGNTWGRLLSAVQPGKARQEDVQSQHRLKHRIHQSTGST